ncbi:MAG: kipI1 [Nocardioidaceae bacterium]|jgi:KipI family sensor histidine kinase inhibitor|nr:kipI1 [Nocardioidaceae bacterium]
MAPAEGARVLRCGGSAALVEVADLAQVLRLYEALLAERPPGVRELVPAARTVLVAYDAGETRFDDLTQAIIERWQAAAERAPEPDHGADVVEVPVHYDGPDLAQVAQLTGLDEAEVVRRHTGGDYRSGFCGFAPGFAYLTGLDPALHVPRRDDPRTRVPAGSVALADEFTAVYPRDSPGGWQLVGHSDIVLWDVERDPPALLAPGTPVRFVDAGSGS